MARAKRSLITEQGEYEGQWRRDARDGYGVMKWADGSRFEGEWKDDQRRRGRMVMADGAVYEGEFRNDRFHGAGTLTLRVGGAKDSLKTFQGVFAEGRAPADGSLYYHQSGDRYTGGHQDFLRQGFGVLVSANGDRYEGEFSEDKREGVGFLTHANGDYYYGEFLNDRKEGVGRQFFKSDGDKVYEGQWQKDLRHGEGALIERDRILQGVWRHGKLEGRTVVLPREQVGAIQVLAAKGLGPALIS